MTKKGPAEIAGSVNEWLERFMPLITPLGILAGFLFPRIFIKLRPLVPLLFGIMTLSGALKLKLREFGQTIKSPLGIGIFLLSSHVLMPLAVLLITVPVFGGDQDTISGFILLYSVPTAVSGFIWISLFQGDRALSLTLILLDTLLAPLLVPGTLALLRGTRVSLDMSGITLALIGMVVCPTIAGVGFNEISRGRIPALVCPYLNPLAKICLTAVIAANTSPVASIIRIDEPRVWLIGAFCIIFTAISYVLAKITGLLGPLGPEKRVTLFFAGGLRNISAATTIAIDFFPGAAALPCLLGIVFQQVMAAIMGRLFLGKKKKAETQGLSRQTGSSYQPGFGKGLRPLAGGPVSGYHNQKWRIIVKKFMDRDFLLSNQTAARLYHEAAAEEKIFDYHCHLIPREIAENRRFPDLASMWLGGDHYKWRALRANGIDEKLITGDGDPYDKFLAWAETVPKTIGNPLFHWTHLELQRYFDIYEPLNRESAPAIWQGANEKLKNDPELSVFGIFKKFKVYALGTTDDPADSLEWHEKSAGATETKVLPSFRPDQALNIEKAGFAEYTGKLGKAAGRNINSLEDLLEALRDRITFFDKRGCRISDHGLEYIPFETAGGDSPGSPINQGRWEKEVKEIFAAALNGKTPDPRSAESWKTFILNFLGEEYANRGWAMQIHIAAIRSVNSRAFKSLGPDTGYDAVHDHPASAKLARFLDLLDSRGKLPKTILYSLNIKDLYTLGTIMGCFQGGGIPGKLQLGSGWWFLDHIDGMETQMKILGNVGLLSRFVGMLTDSRSFLSYPRHEYFRRTLCNILGTWAEKGEIPHDFPLLAGMVKDISFANAARYFLNP